MELYDQIMGEFSELPHLQEWAEVRSFFQRVASGRPAHWSLPARACESVGGNRDQALPAVLAVACSHLSIVLVDDLLDADPRGEHLRVGAPAAANMASALQAAALISISRTRMEQTAKLAALEALHEMFLTTALGQYWDVQSSAVEEADYWRITKTKSSPFFGAAFQLGALMGGASIPVAGRVRELGCLYGEMVQIHDDINDSMTEPANPDWIGDRSPLPILFAQRVDHPQRARFEELRPQAGLDPRALQEAQDILIRCGAISYCVDQLLNRYQTVRGLLSTLSIARPSVLTALFEEIVAPVWELFKAAGESPFE